jgi:DNA (cytosine-5)-methyltransferase 1
MNVPLVAEVADHAIKNVAFGLCSKQSRSMLSDNPHSGFYEAKTARTLDRSGGSPYAIKAHCVVAIQAL